MDKIKINNQVVCMRKFVKQGKIRVINKFVKEIQLLRNRKGGEQKISKCQRKADRLLEEVTILKKIKPDTVSRMALAKSKDWKAVLSQKGVSTEDRCFALLASYDPVQKEVDKFYSENSYLTLKIPTLIQEWEEKSSSLTPQNSFKLNRISNEITKSDPSHSAKENKLIEVKSGKQGSKPRKQSVMLKDDDTLKVRGSEDMMVDDSGNEGTKDTRSGHWEVSYRNHEDSDDIGEESDDNQANSDDNQANSDVNQANSDDNEGDSEDNKEDSDDQDSSDESDMHSDEEKEEEDSCDNDLKNKSKTLSIKESKMKSKPAKNDSNILPLSPVKTANDFKNKIPSLQKNVPLDSNSTKAVALVNLNEMMGLDEIPIVSSKIEEKQASELKKRKKDSFFLKDGREFSDSDQSEDEDSNEDDDGTFNHKNDNRNSFNKKSSFAHHGGTKMEDNSRNFRNKGFSSNTPRGNKFEKGDQKFRNDFHSKQKFNKFNKNESKSYSEQNFKRFNKNDSKSYSEQQNFKKNKWNRGDESDRKGSKPFNNFQEKKPTFSKNKPDNHPRNDFSKTVKKDTPPLHPSWEAKRKLKQAANTKFQGKRMVFDD